MYLTETLPEPIRAAIKADTLAPAAFNHPAVISDNTPNLPQAQQDKAMLRADLLRLYLRALATAP